MRYLILAIISFIPLSFSYAQITQNLSGPLLSIELESDYISPYTENTASVNDYSITTQTANIFWKIDGELKKELTNQRSIDFTSKDVDKTTTIEVTLEDVNGKVYTAKRIISPVYLDIIIEPQTRTPSFYKGRPLPTIDSTVNLIAIINGSNTNANDYIYNWTLNNKNMEGGPIRGKNVVSTIVPMGKYNIVTLSVSDTKGKVIASRNIELTSIEPELKFYEVSTLNGIKSIPIKNSLNLIGNSTNVRAEPFYLDINTYNRPRLIEWKIDGSRSPSSGGNPYEVTLARQGVSGTSRVNFHVRNLDIILQGVESEFTVNY